MTDDELDVLLAKQTEEIRRAPLAAHRQAYVDATMVLRSERDRLRSDLADAITNWQASESEAEQLRTLVQALKFDTDERDRLQAKAARLEQQHDIALNMAEHLTADINAQNARCRLEEVDRMDTERMLISERDSYRAMLCDLLAYNRKYGPNSTHMTEAWNKARQLLKNGPTP